MAEQDTNSLVNSIELLNLEILKIGVQVSAVKDDVQSIKVQVNRIEDRINARGNLLNTGLFGLITALLATLITLYAKTP